MLYFKFKYQDSSVEEIFDRTANRLGLMFPCINRSAFKPYKVMNNQYQLDRANNYWFFNEGEYNFRFGGRYLTKEEDTAFGIVIPLLISGLMLREE